MSEQENIITDENHEIVDETPRIEVPAKTKNPRFCVSGLSFLFYI